MKPMEDLEQAIRDLPLQPRADLEQRILNNASAGLRQPAPTPPAAPRPTYRIGTRIMHNKWFHLATAAVIVAALIVIFARPQSNSHLAAVAFGAVIDQMDKAHTLQWKETIEIEGKPPMAYTKQAIEPGRIRCTTSVGSVLIFDFVQGKTLTLHEASKDAFLNVRVGRPPRRRLNNMVEWISTLHEKQATFAGTEILDQKTVNVFVAEEPYEKMTVWVDPATNLPVRVQRVSLPNPNKDIKMPQINLNENDFKPARRVSVSMLGGTFSISQSTSSSFTVSVMGGPGVQPKTTVTMTDLVWDAPLDEALFSVEPPVDYTVQQQVTDESVSGQEALVQSLRFWAEESDGAFPASIDGMADASPKLLQRFRKGIAPDEEFKQARQMASLLASGLFFAQCLKAENDWHYAGAGVKLDQADKPVCWWQKPDHPETYMVLYGNLILREVPADQKPTAPIAQTQPTPEPPAP